MSTLDNCIGFYMETSLHYNVYKNIIAALQQAGYHCHLIISDVIEPDFVKEMATYLKKQSLEKVIVRPISTLIQNNERYPCIVSPYYTPLLKNRAVHHVRAIYGLAKDRWGHDWWNVFYDKILCYGEHTKSRLNIYDTAAVVGNPRFDDWHNGNFDHSISSILKRSSQQPIILYAPTFGPLSSIPEWAEKLNRLQDQYLILLKLHHRTLLHSAEAENLQLVKRYFNKNLVHDYPILSLFEAADYVITDSSGFIFDAIHADKKIILLTSKKIQQNINDNLTLSDKSSADQVIKRDIPEVSRLPELKNTLSDSYSWTAFQQKCAEYRTYYCDPFQDGNAGKRAAQVIGDLLTNKTRETNFFLQSLRARLLPV